ncbi:hypothetical protein AB4P32_27600, partial [Escherichia coli]
RHLRCSSCQTVTQGQAYRIR